MASALSTFQAPPADRQSPHQEADDGAGALSGGQLTVDIGSLGREWDDVLAVFRDASIYQSRAYAELRGHGSAVEHVVVRRDGRLLAAAQVELVTVPVARAGVARVFWGPMWRLRDAARADLDVALDALRTEYCGRRR